MKFEEKGICAEDLLLGLQDSLLHGKQKCFMCQRLLNVVFAGMLTMDAADQLQARSLERTSAVLQAPSVCG